MAAAKAKALPAPKLTNERLLEIYRSSVGPQARRNPDDAELAMATAALGAIVGKEAAASLAWQRRLAVTVDGQTPLLLVDGHQKPIGQWPPMVHSFPLALSLEAGIELLKSAQNPEPAKVEADKRELDRQRSEAEQRRKARESLEAEVAPQRKLEREQADFRAGDWAVLSALQRFAARMAIAFEKHGQAELAADLRALVAQDIASTDIDSSKDFPRDPTWFAGLGLENISPERKVALSLRAQGERDQAVLDSIPEEKLSSLRMVHGNNRSAIANHWRRIILAKPSAQGASADPHFDPHPFTSSVAIRR